jgi:AmmeMemoRadiSam system protein A
MNPDTETALGNVLLQLARQAIGEEFGLAATARLPALDELHRPAATFVTLSRGGDLRGCIGTLEAWRPLKDDLHANAQAAAFLDTRFMPLTRIEFERVRIEVSLLSSATPLSFTSEADALAQLQPGIDGVILQSGRQRATFLPQVWDSLPEPRHFMQQLKRKAGLADDAWPAGIQLSRYTVKKWHET